METIYHDKTPEQRLEMLKANCLKQQRESIKFFFSEDDLAEMKSRLSELAIEKNDAEDELKLLSKDIRDKIKEQQKKLKTLLQFLKDKYEYQEQDVFEFDDQENGLMLTYNSNGELISNRKLRPNERQIRITSINKTA